MDAETAGALIAVSADVSIVMDKDGVVLDVAFADPGLAKEVGGAWVGRRWSDLVTSETRPKIDDLLNEADTSQPTRWRQVNHPSALGGADVPVRYCAIRVETEQRVVAVGRDLRALAALQQRVAEAQQEMEREYHRIRNAEKRYRLLFQLSSEAILILDGARSRIAEANPAAVALVGKAAKKIVGAAFGDLFDEASRRAAQSFVTALLVAPRVDNVHAQLAESRESLLLSGALFRQDGAANIIVILSADGRRNGALGRKDRHAERARADAGRLCLDR